MLPTLTKGWASADSNCHEVLFWNPNWQRKLIPFTKISMKRESSPPSRAACSSKSAWETLIFPSFAVRQSSRTDWSMTAEELEWRQWEMAPFAASDSGPLDLSFSKMEITANRWIEGWGTRILSKRWEYGSILFSFAPGVYASWRGIVMSLQHY